MRAVVWVDEIRRGATDESGELKVVGVAQTPTGRHTLRVRAEGYAERSEPLLPSQLHGGTVVVRLIKTTDEAELLFQRAEAASESANDETSRAQAAELYRRAIAARPNFAAAHLGLARLFLASENPNGALEEARKAHALRPAYAEASAVEGRALRSSGDDPGAIAAYQRAIREAGGFQPEAYTGLGLIYDERGDEANAVASYRKAIAQLSDTEPIVYQLLGSVYERQENYKAAIAAYQNYLRLAPNGKLAPAVQSIIEQLRLQAADGQNAPNPPLL